MARASRKSGWLFPRHAYVEDPRPQYFSSALEGQNSNPRMRLLPKCPTHSKSDAVHYQVSSSAMWRHGRWRHCAPPSVPIEDSCIRGCWVRPILTLITCCRFFIFILDSQWLAATTSSSIITRLRVKAQVGLFRRSVLAMLDEYNHLPQNPLKPNQAHPLAYYYNVIIRFIIFLYY